MELRDALVQIAEIRESMARGAVFRGYRAATTGFSGAVAVATGILQAMIVPDVAKYPAGFIGLWVGAAAICLMAVGVEMFVRTKRSRSDVQRSLTIMAAEGFVPSVVAGALMAYVFGAFIAGGVWMLPGVWMVLFAMGVFASGRLLPREVFWVAGYYLLAGVAALVVGSKGLVSPGVEMMVGFGVGQSLAAGVLWFKLERGAKKVSEVCDE
ncbi:MAG: hypothetical protein ACTHN5_15365 [Phycisphaerae bacterium]